MRLSRLCTIFELIYTDGLCPKIVEIMRSASMIILLICLMSFSLNAQETAAFAGGCFWCVQEAMDNVDGVIYTRVGFIGGQTKNPTYKEVSSGKTKHLEAVQVYYDPKRISYQGLLTAFWHNIDPTAKDQQFCDEGKQYRSAIFYQDQEQKRLAEESKNALIESRKFGHVYTEILPATAFYEAEAYHQNYYKKNPFRYRIYKYLCGRKKRLRELWGNDH